MCAVRGAERGGDAGDEQPTRRMCDEDHAVDSRVLDIGQHRADALVHGEGHRVGRLVGATGQVDRAARARQARDQPVPERARGAATMDEHEPEILHRVRSVTGSCVAPSGLMAAGRVSVDPT